jgi:hypothetical protein
MSETSIRIPDRARPAYPIGAQTFAVARMRLMRYNMAVQCPFIQLMRVQACMQFFLCVAHILVTACEWIQAGDHDYESMLAEVILRVTRLIFALSRARGSVMTPKSVRNF